MKDEGPSEGEAEQEEVVFVECGKHLQLSSSC